MDSFLIKMAVMVFVAGGVLWAVRRSLVRERPIAERVIQDYFHLLDTQQVSTLFNLFDAEYFYNRRLTREDWTTEVLHNTQLLGNMLDYNIINWEEKRMEIGGKMGVYYTYDCAVTYANDTTREKFLLHQAGGAIRILSLDITPNRLELRQTPRTTAQVAYRYDYKPEA